MSDPVARQRPMIDLDEFERRLRRPAGAPQQDADDPLAELARLVGGEADHLHDLFEADRPNPQSNGTRAAPRPSAGPAPRARAPLEPPPQTARPTPPQMRRQEPQQGRFAERAPVAPARRAGRFEDVPPTAPAANSPSVRAARAPEPPPAGAWPKHPSLRSAGLTPARDGARPRVRAPVEPDYSQQNPVAHGDRSQSLGGNFAAIEAGLRGSIQPDYHAAPAPAYPQAHAPAYDHSAGPDDDDDGWFDEGHFAPPSGDVPPPRSRRLLYLTGVIILIGLGGIGATFALKRTPSGPQQIATIKASTAPAKVKLPPPVQSAGAKAAIQDASILSKTQSAPITVISHKEEPVNLAQAEAKAASGARGQGAASVPVPPPPGGTGVAASPASTPNWQGGAKGAVVADAAPGQAFGLAGIIKPRMVKTVTVRPDGTIVGEGASPAPPVTANSVAGGGVESASGNHSAAANTDQGAKAEAPPATKNTARIAPAKIAAPSVHATHTAETHHQHQNPVKVASLDNGRDRTSAAATGRFAVQLAARTTVAQARSAMTRLMHRYSQVLAGHQLKYHHAEVNGKSFYRVRVSGLTRTAAMNLCAALQAKGGSCFVARD